jgi:hypothetical protein
VHALRRDLERGRARLDADADPRFGRALTWTLAAGAASDFLQAGFAALYAKVNELEKPA